MEISFGPHASLLERGALRPNGYAYGDRVGGDRLDVQGIAAADAFTMSLSKASADDALVAAGMALASGRPSAYVVSDRKELPWFLREADRVYPGQVRIVPDAAALRAVSAAASVGAPAPLGPPIDRFIGCLMSGLTEAQYQEGHAHLEAIDRSLGPGTTHCEGLMVRSTSTFDMPAASLTMDMDALRRSDRCIFYLYDGTPRPSGTWVEAGAAIALGKPTTFLVPDRAALPPSLRDEPPPGVRVIEYGDHARLLGMLAEGQAL